MVLPIPADWDLEEMCDVRSAHLDPRAPFVLDLHDLGRQPGSMRELNRIVAAPEHLGSDVIGIPPGSELEFDLRLEAVSEGVLVTGSVRGQAVGECVRCLEQVVQTIDLTIQELFRYPERAAAATADGDEDEDLRELDGALADLEPVVRDAIIPVLPFGPLCQDDCPGLCSECGARLADDLDHTHEIRDPRWSALASLTGIDENKKEG